MRPTIPVFDTIGHGFYFGISRFLPILRITWLPAALAGLLFMAQIYMNILVSRGQLLDLGNLPDYTSLLVGIPFYALLSIPAVAAYRMAIFGTRAPGGIAYFRFGGTELQFLAAQIVTTVWMIVFLILVALAIIPVSLLAFQLMAGGAEAVAGAIADDVSLRFQLGIGAWALFSALSFFGLILLSLVQPMVVAEHRIRLWRSVRLLWLGNALRLALVWAIVGACFAMFSVIAFLVVRVYGPGILQAVLPQFDNDNVFHILAGWTAIILLPSIVIGALALGVTAGINGYVYRILVLKPAARQSQ